MPAIIGDDVRAILDRLGRDRWGIGTAAVYLRQLNGCLRKTGLDADELAEAIKEAENKLTFCDPGMEIVTKRKRGKEFTEGAIMEFEAVVTSNRLDRDGDVLDPDGAEVDPKAPLLWQHLMMEPIGKLLEVTQQNKKRVKARFAIADTPLGRDAATLVEFGALRISHGFLPTEWEERESKDGEFLGWHIRKYDLIEVSLVSVPSNVDAVVMASERAKLHHPYTKALASAYKRTRPVQVRGIEFAKEVVKYREYASQDRNAEWDIASAKRRVKEWAQGDAEKFDLTDESQRSRYREAFAVVYGDGTQQDHYKLLHHDYRDGELVTNYRACLLGIRAVNGATHETVVDETDRDGAYEHLARHIEDGWGDDPPELTDLPDTDEEKGGQRYEKTIPANPPNGDGVGVEGTWRAPTLADFTDERWADLTATERNRIARHFAWYADLDTFGALRLPHHFPPNHDDAGKASLNGVRNALARANQVDGLSGADLDRVMAHLRAHLPERAVASDADDNAPLASRAVAEVKVNMVESPTDALAVLLRADERTIEHAIGVLATQLAVERVNKRNRELNRLLKRL